MSHKTRVAVLFGGQSAEHEVSLQSAKNLLAALDPARYETVLIGIDKQGRWHHAEPEALKAVPIGGTLALNGNPLAISPGHAAEALPTLPEGAGRVDVVFPILHGPHGEDGTVQGLLRLAGIPFVGCDVLGSAVGMDKDVMKRLLRDAGLPIAKFRAIRREEGAEARYADLVEELGSPLFVKPANLGSSVGIHKVRTEKEWSTALSDAFSYDSKVMVEEFVPCRELEVAVLGNETPEASIVGEIVPTHDFYDYEAKYLDANGARLEIPAPLPESIALECRRLALETYRVLCAEGLARIDFFLTTEQRLLVNEINTMPGFTRSSMFPKLWEATGLSYPALIDRLIDLALARHTYRMAKPAHV
ncbi:MAG: D-alanine--D-alanine ligase family protein [Verrucomicrobiia bacterium]